jgi:non-ribosomal peptide synthetase component E (peptide arylation enzyme)
MGRERDSKFVELGRYLCEVRAGQYWRVDNVHSFDEFLERKFPESRRKAYYLMAIHERLPRIHKVELQQVARDPEAAAVTFEGRQMSYRELNQWANQVAHYLRKFGVGPESLVGIPLV